jgi:pilus assembly protein FimV
MKKRVLVMQCRTLALILAIMGLFFTSLASALGLGEITLKSSLNEPLNAEIRLLEVRGLARSEIAIQLASREDFQRAGIERAFFLNDIKFEVDLDDRSAPVIRLESKKSVVEPYLNFVLEVRWPSGRLLREYTVLMDLPVFDIGSTTAPVATPKAPITTPAKPAKKEAAQSLPSAIQVAPTTSISSSIDSPTAVVPSLAPTEYRVEGGDTLWKIALQARPDSSITVNQSMLAIQRANPEAFIDGNINLLRKGEVLRFPDTVEMQRTTVQQAISEVNRQNQQWSATKSDAGAVLKGDSEALRSTGVPSSKPEGRLKLSSIENTSATNNAKGSGVSGTGKSLENELAIAQEELDRTKRENIEFSERVKQLEEQVGTMEKLIEVSNDKLRVLQLTAAEKEEPNAATETSEMTDVAVQTRGVINDITDTEQSERSIAAVTETSGSAEASSTLDTTGRSDVIPPAVESKGGVIDMIKDNAAYIAGAAVVLLLAVLLVRLRNKGDDDDFDITDEEAMAMVDENQSEFKEVIKDQYNKKMNAVRTDTMPHLDDGQLEDSIGDDVDAIEKANIFISLGQYGEAEKQLLREIEANPDNTGARLNLLKVYSDTKNVSEFDVQYAQLLPMGDVSTNQRAKQLRAAIPNAGHFDVSRYVAGEPIQSPAEAKLYNNSNRQLSIDSTVNKKEDLSLDLDFDFSDLDKKITEDNSLFGDDKPAHDAELKLKKETLKYSGASLNDKQRDTFSEIDLDLNDLSSDKSNFGEIQEEYVFDTENDSKDGLDKLKEVSVGGLSNQRDDDAIAELVATEQVSDIDGLDFVIDNNKRLTEQAEDIDLDDDILSEATNDKSILPAVSDTDDKSTLNFFSSSDEVDMASLDKEIGLIIGDQPESADKSNDELAFDDDLSILGDDADEVDIKLDLASAYLDMGDNEGAKDILNEVIEEGTADQQDKARNLLGKL